MKRDFISTNQDRTLRFRRQRRPNKTPDVLTGCKSRKVAGLWFAIGPNCDVMFRLLCHGLEMYGTELGETDGQDNP